MPQIQREGTIGVETADTHTGCAASLEGILEGPVERVGSGRVEEGPATAKVVTGDGPVGEAMRNM
jgi:hypothetical protein